MSPHNAIAMRRYPTSFVVLTVLGVFVGIPGVMSMAGAGTVVHPLLEDPMAGLALVVSAIALIGSGLFPYAIARLVNQQQ